MALGSRRGELLALAAKAGLPADAHLHTLRHSAASFVAADGVPPSDIAGVLGHAGGGAFALRVYIRPLGEGIARAAEHLDKAIGGEQRGSPP